MRSFFLLLMLALFSQILFSQQMEWLYQDELITRAEQVIALEHSPFPEQHWLVAGRSGVFPEQKLFLVWLDDAGEQVGFMPVNFFLENSIFERAGITGLAELPDGRLFIAGYTGACDLAPFGFAMVFDLDEGAPVWVEESLEVPETVTYTEDGDLVLAGDYYIELRDAASGELIWQTFQSLPYCEDVLFWNDSIWVAHSEGVALFDSAGAFAGIPVSLDEPLHVLELYQPDVLILFGEEEVALYDPVTQTLSTQVLDGYLIDGDVYQDTLYCLVFDGNNNHTVQRFDADLNELGSFTAFDIYAAPTGMVIHEDELVIAGSDLSKYPPVEGSEVAMAKSFDLQGNTFSSGVDVAVSAMQLYGGASATQAVNCPWAYDITYEDLWVTVTNYGEEIVDELSVCGNFTYCAAFCYFSIEVKKDFSDLSLQPGESVNLPIGDLYLLDQTFEDPTENLHKLCLWTTRPNDSRDIDHENDEFCGFFGVGISSDRETLASAGPKVIYLQDVHQLLIETQKDGWNDRSSWSLFDISGRFITGGKVPSNGYCLLPPLAAGLYVVRVQEGERIGNTRLYIGAP